MLRTLVILTLVAVVAYFGSTVKLGQRTFFGHVRAIWATDEARDMRQGLEEKAGPALDRMKRGVKAGIKAAADEDGGPIEAPGEDGGGAGPIGDGDPGGGTSYLPAEPASPSPPERAPGRARRSGISSP